MRVVILLLLGLTGSTLAWNYNENGDDWATSGADDYNPTCAMDRQSPIDIIPRNAIEYCGDEMLDFAASYCDTISGYFKNNGHTLQFDIDVSGDGEQDNPSAASSYITGGPLGSGKYYFWQFHFHWGSGAMGGSEHTVSGHQYPAEVHLVHVREDYVNDISAALADPSGLSVLGIFIEGGANSTEVDTTWFDVISNASKAIVDSGDYTTRVSGIEMNLNDFVHRINPTFESEFNYWHYEGSLTTPDCNEAVMWLVAEHPIKVTDDQLIAFESLTESDDSTLLTYTYRNVQPDNCRKLSYVNLNNETMYTPDSTSGGVE